MRAQPAYPLLDKSYLPERIGNEGRVEIPSKAPGFRGLDVKPRQSPSLFPGREILCWVFFFGGPSESGQRVSRAAILCLPACCPSLLKPPSFSNLSSLSGLYPFDSSPFWSRRCGWRWARPHTIAAPFPYAVIFAPHFESPRVVMTHNTDRTPLVNARGF